MLLQQGKGGDMASAFGGGGSQTAFGARAGATVLTQATAVLGALFMIGAFALGIIGKRGETSLMGGVQGAPASQAPAPAPLPAPTATPARSSSLRRQRRRPRDRRRTEVVGTHAGPSQVGPHPRESGGTGRRTSLRGWRSQERGGSNPPFRTSLRLSRTQPKACNVTRGRSP